MDDQVEQPASTMQKEVMRNKLSPGAVIRLKELLPAIHRDERRSTLALSLELNVGLLLARAQILLKIEHPDLSKVIDMAVELSVAIGNQELLARCCVWQGLMIQQWNPNDLDGKFEAFESAAMILGHDRYPESRWLREFIEQNREKMERWNARRRGLDDNDDADSLYNHLFSDTMTPGLKSNDLIDIRDGNAVPEATDTDGIDPVTNNDEFQGIDYVLQKIKDGKIVRGRSSRRGTGRRTKLSDQYISNTDASNTQFSKDNKAQNMNEQDKQAQEEIPTTSRRGLPNNIIASQSDDDDVVVVEVPPPNVTEARRRSSYISQISAQLIRSQRGTSTPASLHTRSNLSSRKTSSRAAEIDQSLRDLTGVRTRQNTLESRPSIGMLARFKLAQRNDRGTQPTDKPIDLTDTPAATIARNINLRRLSIDTDMPVGQSRPNSTPIHHSPLAEVVSAEGADEIGA